MARIARVVVPGIPHHITQRGNRRMETFFSDGDYREYLYLMAEWANRCKVQVWAYCLMPNHVQLIVVPESEDGLGRAIGEAHRRYTRYINFQKGWKGHLWQGRFASFPMDEQYLIAAARYIELNPVKAGIVKRPEAYRWSSAKAHLQGEDDILVKVEPLLSLIPDWEGLLSRELTEKEYETLRRHERSGRPLGDDNFLSRLEKLTDRVLRKQKPGPKNN
ncbi:MAG: transposase [Desulfobulbaceae bacterium]|nr:transposase [Desulfobulbaceae bacterium]